MSSSNRWYKGRDSDESARLKRHRLCLEEEHSEWVVEIHVGCIKNDAIRKTKFGEQEQHLSCYDKTTRKRHCFSTLTLALLYLRNNQLRQPPTFQSDVKPTTHILMDELLKKMGKTTLKDEDQKSFDEQFSKYLGGQLPTGDIYCCPVCYEDARDDVVDPIRLIGGEPRLLQSCFLTSAKLGSHLDIVHNVNNEAKSEMKITLDRYMLRESGGLVDQFCHTLGANFRHHYWDLDRVEKYLAIFEHLKKTNLQSCPKWKKLHGVIDENPKVRDEEFIATDTEEESSSSSDSDSEENTTVIVKSPSKRKRVMADSESEFESDTEVEVESDTEVEVEFINTERCCVHCVGVEMVRMSTRNCGCDEIFCDGGRSCPLNGDPFKACGLFYGCTECKAYDLCEDCYHKH